MLDISLAVVVLCVHMNLCFNVYVCMCVDACVYVQVCLRVCVCACATVCVHVHVFVSM